MSLVVFFLTWLSEAFALQIVTRLVACWLCTITAGLPADIKLRKRVERASHVWEQTKFYRDAGYAPRAVALQVLADMLLGAPIDFVQIALRDRWEAWWRMDEQEMQLRLLRLDAEFAVFTRQGRRRTD